MGKVKNQIEKTRLQDAYLVEKMISDEDISFDSEDKNALKDWMLKEINHFNERGDFLDPDKNGLNSHIAMNTHNFDGDSDKIGSSYCLGVLQTDKYSLDSSLSSVLESNNKLPKKEIINPETRILIENYFGIDTNLKQIKTENEDDLISKIFSTCILLNIREDSVRIYESTVFSLFQNGVNYLGSHESGSNLKYLNYQKDGVIHALTFLLTSFINTHSHKILNSNHEAVSELFDILHSTYRTRTSSDQKDLASLILVERIRKGNVEYKKIYRKLVDSDNIDFRSGILEELTRILALPKKQVQTKIKNEALNDIKFLLESVDNEDKYRSEEYKTVSHLLFLFGSQKKERMGEALEVIASYFQEIDGYNTSQLNDVDILICVNYFTYLIDKFKASEEKEKIYEKIELFHTQLPPEYKESDFAFNMGMNSIKRNNDGTYGSDEDAYNLPQ